MTKHSALTLKAALLVVTPMIAAAEVDFPLTRNTVGSGEFYRLDEGKDWSAWCLRDRNSDDYCHTARAITALDHGLELDFGVYPLDFLSSPSQADVDVAPRAIVGIHPYSEALHYGGYSASITSVDGKPFDGYWCPLTSRKSWTDIKSWINSNSCIRGPDLIQIDLLTLLEGNSATVTIYDRASTPEQYKIVTEIEVDLASMAASFERSKAFNAEIHGVDLTKYETPFEMCDFYVHGIQRRISYTFDKDFDGAQTSHREKLLGPRVGGSCPSYVTLAHLTPELTPAQRNMFCLIYDKEAKNIVGFQQGEQDSYRVCKTPSRSLCERVNAVKDEGIAIASFAAGAVGGALGTTTVTGTTVVMHSSGAAILTGSAGYVAGTLGTFATTTLGILTAPATITAAAVSVVAVGGAVFVCRDTDV